MAIFHRVVKSYTLVPLFASLGILSVYHAPANAASFTVTGFTGAFAPSQWTIDNSNGGAAVATPTDVTFTLPTTSSSASSFIFNTANLATQYPNFTQGTVKFDWTWTSPVPVTPIFSSNLQYQVNNANPVELTNYTGPTPPTIIDTADINNFIVSSANVTFNVSAGDSFLFRLQGVSPSFGVSSANISSFSFTGTDGTSSAAPAPLPILGAVAAFGFGRRIRRRLAQSATK
jgi:hypothetical protein